jgi:hypothetical protein
MKTPWFKLCGWLYRPVTASAWAVVLLALGFCVHIFVFFDTRSHSVTDTLYHIFPLVVPTFLLVEWIARKTSTER